jgi:hypothetical protein
MDIPPGLFKKSSSAEKPLPPGKDKTLLSLKAPRNRKTLRAGGIPRRLLAGRGPFLPCRFRRLARALLKGSPLFIIGCKRWLKQGKQGGRFSGLQSVQKVLK